MPAIGLDCEIILDGTGYFLKPGSYHVKQPRLRHTSYRADGSLSYVDLGPGKRSWSMIIIAHNELLCYDGTQVSLSGQQFRDTLHNSYSNNIGAPITLIDPLNGSGIAVHFDEYEEIIYDLHSQMINLATGGTRGASYDISILLLEA